MQETGCCLELPHNKAEGGTWVGRRRGQDRVSDLLWSGVMRAWEAPKRFCPRLYLQLSIIKLVKWTVFYFKIQISNFPQDPPNSK